MGAVLLLAALGLHVTAGAVLLLVVLALLQGWWDGLLIPLLQSRLMNYPDDAPRTHRSADFEVASRVGMIAGPVVAGVLLAGPGRTVALGAAGVLMMAAAGLLANNPLVRVPAKSTAVGSSSAVTDLAGSIAAVRARPWLSLALGVRGVSNFLWPAFTIGIPLLVLSPWHAGAAGYGVLRALWGASTVGATLLLTTPAILGRLRSAYFVSWAVSGLGFLTLAASPAYGWAIGATLMGGMGSPLVHVALDSEIGEHIPPAQQGHVFALQRLVMSALTLIGLAVLGQVVAVLGAAALGLVWHPRQRAVRDATRAA